MALTESENDANGLLLVPMYCSFCGKGEMVNPDDLNAAQQKLMSHDQRCSRLIGWISFWIVSFPWWLIKDVVIAVYDTMAHWYEKIRINAMK